MSAVIEELKLKVSELRRRTVQNCPELEAEFQQAQARADRAYRTVGRDGAPPHLLGESLVDYRQRLLRNVQAQSKTWQHAGLPRAQDSLAVIEQQVYREVENTLTDPSSYQPGELRQVVERDQTGRPITKFYGDPGVTWSPFQPTTLKFVKGFGK